MKSFHKTCKQCARDYDPSNGIGRTFCSRSCYLIYERMRGMKVAQIIREQL